MAELPATIHKPIVPENQALSAMPLAAINDALSTAERELDNLAGYIIKSRKKIKRLRDEKERRDWNVQLQYRELASVLAEWRSSIIASQNVHLPKLV